MIFIIYIDVIIVCLDSYVAKFGNNTKMENLVISDHDKHSFQDDAQTINIVSY